MPSFLKKPWVIAVVIAVVVIAGYNLVKAKFPSVGQFLP
jgi:Flp pilus assembly pilin Flp